MSVENAQSFYLRVTTDEEFRIQLEQIATVEERQQTIQAAGYEFTAKEWETVSKQILAASDSNEEELSDAELTAVSGGANSSILELLELIGQKPLFPITPLYGAPTWIPEKFN